MRQRFGRSGGHYWWVCLWILINYGHCGTVSTLYDSDSLELTRVIVFGLAGPGESAVDIAARSTLGDTLTALKQDGS